MGSILIRSVVLTALTALTALDTDVDVILAFYGLTSRAVLPLYRLRTCTLPLLAAASALVMPQLLYVIHQSIGHGHGLAASAELPVHQKAWPSPHRRRRTVDRRGTAPRRRPRTRSPVPQPTSDRRGGAGIHRRAGGRRPGSAVAARLRECGWHETRTTGAGQPSDIASPPAIPESLHEYVLTDGPGADMRVLLARSDKPGRRPRGLHRGRVRPRASGQPYRSVPGPGAVRRRCHGPACGSGAALLSVRTCRACPPCRRTNRSCPRTSRPSHRRA